MSLSHITISFNSHAESVGSSTSHMILSNSKAAVVAIPDIAPEISLEATPSPDYVSASPDYVSKSDPKESPKEDPQRTILQATTPAILVQHGQAISFGRSYRIHHNKVCMMLTVRERVRAPPTLLLATEADIAQWIATTIIIEFVVIVFIIITVRIFILYIVIPYTGLSRKRSCISSSSSETSHPSSSPPPYKRHRSPTPPLPATKAAVPTPTIEMLRPRKRFRGTSYASQEDVYAETTIEAMLGNHSEMIEEMYEHLLDITLIRLETAEHELETLRGRVVSSERDCFFTRQG
nr:hypothetical protein [Tanacetum cinerariifolium]